MLGRILVGFNGQTIAERELTPGRFIIGRTPDNDLQIDSKYISRHHAQIITSAQHLGAGGSEQHQRHLRARQARAPPHAQ